MTDFLRVALHGADAVDHALEQAGASCRVIGGMRVTIGATAPYAGYVHEGTSTMPARPFVSNAVRRHTGDYERRIARAIPDGPDAVMRAALQGGREILDTARAEAPVRTGYLRGSLYMRLR